MKEGWEIKKLGEVCETSSGGTPSKTHKEYYECGNIPWLRSGEISQGLIYDTELYITEEGLNKSSAKIFPIDTVVIAMYGATVGQVGILKQEMSTNQAVCGIFPTKYLTPLFLVYYLRAKKSYFLSLASGGAQPNISQNIIKNTLIPIPPLEEQERIVGELDCLSGVIEKKKEQLKELDALAQSIFYEMFGNPLENERGWGLKRIVDVCEVNPSKKETSKGLNEADFVSFLPMEDLPIKAGYYQPEKMRILSEVQSSYTCFANNDVLMAKVTPCFENGKIGMVRNLQNGVGYGSSEFIVIRVKDTIVVKEFIYFVIQDSLFIENACAQLTGTSGLRRVPRQYVENCNITVPPLLLQQEFAEKIESIEKQKELIRKSIEEVEMLFNSRMEYYFG